MEVQAAGLLVGTLKGQQVPNCDNEDDEYLKFPRRNKHVDP